MICSSWQLRETCEFPHSRSTSHLWHIKHCGGSHLIKPTSGRAVQLYENRKHSNLWQSDSPALLQGRCAAAPTETAPARLPRFAARALSPAAGKAGTAAGKAGTAPGGAASGRKRLPSALYGRASGHVNSYGGRRRGAAAAGQLVSYGGVGALPAACLPPLRSGDSGERPEGPARRRSPPGTRRAGVALGARQEPPQTPPVLGGSGSPERKGPAKTRAGHKTRAVPSLEPGGRSSLK